MSNYLQVGTLPTMFKSPTQASDNFSQDGLLPKQKHVFVVNFIPGFQHNARLGDLSFVVKSIDRPSIEPTVEVLNQYNKRRQVQTGYKTSPVKMTFWDSAKGDALKMFQDYTLYYFGDFKQKYDSYKDDVTFPNFKDQANAGFGFTAANGGNTTPDGKFYLTKIQILHIYAKTYDMYTLYNPKFTSFVPDELDYGDGGINTISATVSYEALHVAIAIGESALLWQFNTTSATGGSFSGNPFNIPGTETTVSPFPPTTAIQENVDPNLLALFGATNPVSPPESYRYTSGPGGGILGLFGGFSFGLQAGVGVGASTGGLGSALGGGAGIAGILGAGIGALVSVNIDPGSGLATPPGVDLPGSGLNIPTALFNTAAATAQGAFAGSDLSSAGDAVNAVTTGVVGATVVAGAQAGIVENAGGVTLSPTAYGLINANGNGAAQYGLNTQSAPFAAKLGFTNVAFQNVGFPDPSNTNSTPAGTSAALGASLASISGRALPPAAPPAYATVTAIAAIPTPATSRTALSSVGSSTAATVSGTATLTSVSATPDIAVTRSTTSQTVSAPPTTGSVAVLTTSSPTKPTAPGVTVVTPGTHDLSGNQTVGLIPLTPPPPDAPDTDITTDDPPYSD